jgi:hypothetical protein
MHSKVKQEIARMNATKSLLKVHRRENRNVESNKNRSLGSQINTRMTGEMKLRLIKPMIGGLRNILLAGDQSN